MLLDFIVQPKIISCVPVGSSWVLSLYMGPLLLIKSRLSCAPSNGKPTTSIKCQMVELWPVETLEFDSSLAATGLSFKRGQY